MNRQTVTVGGASVSETKERQQYLGGKSEATFSQSTEMKSLFKVWKLGSLLPKRAANESLEKGHREKVTAVKAALQPALQTLIHSDPSSQNTWEQELLIKTVFSISLSDPVRVSFLFSSNILPTNIKLLSLCIFIFLLSMKCFKTWISCIFYNYISSCPISIQNVYVCNKCCNWPYSEGLLWHTRICKTGI